MLADFPALRPSTQDAGRIGLERRTLIVRFWESRRDWRWPIAARL